MDLSSAFSNLFHTEESNNNAQKQVMPRKRNPFSPNEDKQLLELVKLYGSEKQYVWNIISLKMNGRSARQCRERYKLYLDEGIKRNVKWTKEEDEILLSKYELHGPHWKFMEKYFTGRTSYSIKNRYISLKKKQSKGPTNTKNEANDDNNIIINSFINDDINFEDIFFF